MSFLDKPLSEMSLADIQRLISVEVSAQIPPIPAGLRDLRNLDVPVVMPDVNANGQVLTYNQAANLYQPVTITSATPGTDSGTPGTPVVTLTAGPGWIQAKWPLPSGTSDPLKYKVFARSGSAPTTADDTFLVGTTTALSFVFAKLADGTQVTDTGSYHVKVLAISQLSGGATGAASADVSGAPLGVDGSVLTVSNISAANIITGNLTAVVSVTSGAIQTAAAGTQRAVMDSAGLHLYDASSALIIDLPTDSTKTAYFSGSVTVGSLLAGTTAAMPLGGVGALVSSGPTQPITAPGLTVTAGGSLAATTDYYVSYAWASANELRVKNQADFEKDTSGIAKINGAETLTSMTGTLAAPVNAATNAAYALPGYGPGSLKVVTTAASGEGIIIGSAVGAVTNDFPVDATKVYSFSCWLTRDTSATVIFRFTWKDASGTSLGTNDSAAITMTTSMVEYNTQLVNITPTAGAVFGSVSIITQAATASTFWVDNAQVVQAASIPAGTWVPPMETSPYVPPAKVTTTTPNKTISCVLPIAPTGATKAHVYLGTATFAAGGAGGVFQTVVAVSTSATTTMTMASRTTTGALSLTATTWGTWSNGFVYGSGLTSYIRPNQAVDSTGAQQGWSLEGNGRARFLGPTLNTQFWIYDDFFQSVNALAIGTNYAHLWTIRGQGTAAAVTNGSSSNVNPGVVNLSTGSTTTGRATLSTNLSIGLGAARLRFSCYFQTGGSPPDGTNSFNIMMGISDKSGASTGLVPLVAAANGILFQLQADNNGFNLCLASADGGTLVTSNFGTTLSNNSYYFVEWEVDAGRTAINWWVNFVKQTAITTHIPPVTALMGVAIGITKTATGAGISGRTFNVDAVSLYGDYVSG